MQAAQRDLHADPPGFGGRRAGPGGTVLVGTVPGRTGLVGAAGFSGRGIRR
ncbi:hypothetical protein GCM10008937_14120 [Deinococcus depolymerans]|uniref:Uncharacterized protein n=1 Tax=Deinococcus depolymerans TaxID=392408 RepID=A0ABP3LWE2_9DEIO